MKKSSIYISLVAILMLILLPTTFANAATCQSYKEIIDNTINTYGIFEENINFYATGLIYGEFIDFDNDSTKEMVLIYKKKNDNSHNAPWAYIAIYGMSENTPVKLLEEGIYGSLGQTDVSYQILIRDVGGQKYLLLNSQKTYVANGDSENIIIFTMQNNKALINKYYGEVLPWWDTYEFRYTKCMIDDKAVSEKDYTDILNSFYTNSQRINLFLGKDYDNFSFCSNEKVHSFIEEAKNISNAQNKTITGILNERYVKDGLGDDVQSLILTLDTPQNFQAADMFGEIFNATNVAEVQVVAKNYTSDMDGSKVKITAYDEIFEGHTFYHIRPIVINGAVIEIMEKYITVTLDNKKLVFDQPPIIVDGRTLVPLRSIFEAMGATVEWDGATQTVVAAKGNTTISMSIGKAEMYKNGKLITLDIAPQLVGGRTLVPVRAVAEGFNCNVEWNGDSNTVSIRTADNEAYDAIDVTYTISPKLKSEFESFVTAEGATAEVAPYNILKSFDCDGENDIRQLMWHFLTDYAGTYMREVPNFNGFKNQENLDANLVRTASWYWDFIIREYYNISEEIPKFEKISEFGPESLFYSNYYYFYSMSGRGATSYLPMIEKVYDLGDNRYYFIYKLKMYDIIENFEYIYDDTYYAIMERKYVNDANFANLEFWSVRQTGTSPLLKLDV